MRKEEPPRKNDFQRLLAESESLEEDRDKCEDNEEEEEKPETLYNLDQQVNVWSDYLRARFHPRTNHLLNEYQHGNALKPFDTHGLGRMAYKQEGEEVMLNSDSFLGTKCIS